MNKFVLALIFFSCFNSLAQSAAPASALAQTLIADSTAVFEAQKTKDTEALRRLLSPDFQYINSTGALQKADDILDDTKDGKLKSYRIYDVTVLPVNGDAEIVTFNAIIEKPEGDDYLEPRYQRFSDLWIRQGGQWKLKFEQSSTIRHVD